jgi:ketosteroid isomerase-like protein
MKWFTSVIAGIFALSLALAVSAAASDKGEVEAAYKTFNTAFNKGDAKAVAALYTDDAIILPADGGKVVKGPADIEKFFAGFFANKVTGHTLDIIEVKASGKFLVSASKWSAKVEGGSPFGGFAIHVFQKQSDGTLKLTLHTYNYPQK